MEAKACECWKLHPVINSWPHTLPIANKRFIIEEAAESTQYLWKCSVNNVKVGARTGGKLTCFAFTGSVQVVVSAQQLALSVQAAVVDARRQVRAHVYLSGDVSAHFKPGTGGGAQTRNRLDGGEAHPVQSPPSYHQIKVIYGKPAEQTRPYRRVSVIIMSALAR